MNTPECQHDWHRAPERDQLAGMFPTVSATLVFWCSKCLKVEARKVRFTDTPPEATL